MTAFRIVKVGEIHAYDVILGWSIDGGQIFELAASLITVTARTESRIFGSCAGMPYDMEITPDMLLMERVRHE